jgi:hypothetical protein
MLKLSLAFLVGLVIGASIIVQVQRTAFKVEIDCLEQASKTGYNCQAESDWLDLVQFF